MAEPNDKLDIWKVIPPEEKIELMSKAQSKGIFSCIITIIICSTIAVSLKLDWVLWSGLAVTPFIFQFSAGKAWRGLRPRAMLEYLAARSAARRYAFTLNAKDLSLQLMFKGTIEHVFAEEKVQEALEATFAQNKEAEVWIALFTGAVVLMSEKPGGAKIEFGHLVNEKLAVDSNAPEGAYRDTPDREVRLICKDTKGIGTGRCAITSRYPAALVVFEKQLAALILNHEKSAVELEAPEEPSDPDADRFRGMGE